MVATTVGPLKVIIGGDHRDLDRALSGAEARIARFGGRMTSIVAGLGVTAAVAGFLALTKQSFATIDAQAELAYRVGGTISAVQTLGAVADKAGVSSEQLSKSLGLMNMRLAEAARTGSGPAYEALRRVGLSASDLIKLNVDERLAVLADRFEKLGLTAGQQAEVLRAFGIRGQEMINLLEGGGDAIRKTRKDLEAYGVALSTIDGAQVEAANDALKDAKLAITGVANQISVALSPLIGGMARDFADAAKQTGGFRESITQMVDRGVMVLGHLHLAVVGLRREWETLGALEIKFQAPDWASFLGGAKSTITVFENEAARLRRSMAPPPTIEEWTAWWEQLKKGWAEAAAATAGSQAALLGRRGANQDALTEEQRQALEQRFLALQRSLANEAAALDFWRKEEALKLKEFNDKGIGTEAERNAARLAIETKYQQDKANLVWSKLEEGVATENEILARKHAEQLRLIGEFEAARTITENHAAELRRQHTEKQALALLQLQAKQYAGLAGIVDTAMGHISQIIGKEGGAAFEVMKAISMATALVKGFEATVSAYAYGAAIGGPPLGVAMAAVAAAGTAAQIANIARQQPQGSGGTVTAPASSGAGAAASAPQSAAAPGGTLTVQGIDPSSLYSGEMVRALAARLLQFQRDGGQVVLA
ncbi:hypothetical protein [Bradyrhizobium sp.]|uniref:hypothetical protein n=1 Tax=Bradyrhizobium sp. TaxID=376 RepID=UPI0025B8D863|nr:hypothetical protein [Bradyrhizobium sp.]